MQQGIRSVTLYSYDRQLRPGTIGADFEDDGDPNKGFTRRYEAMSPDMVKMLSDIAEWLGESL